MDPSKDVELAEKSSAAAPSPPPHVEVDISNPNLEVVVGIENAVLTTEHSVHPADISPNPPSLERQGTVQRLSPAVADKNNDASVTPLQSQDNPLKQPDPITAAVPPAAPKQPDPITSALPPAAPFTFSPPPSSIEKDLNPNGFPNGLQQKRVLWIEKGANKEVFGEDLGSPLPDGPDVQFWADTPAKSIISPTSADGAKSPIRRRLLGGYSKDNILRRGYRYLLLFSTVLFVVLCWVGDSQYRPQSTQIEDFLYRMLAFACATVCAATALHCYLMVLEVKHAEKLASALCASALAALSMATHLIIGFQAMPLIQNYADRTVHVVRWVEKITETFILIFVVEALNWRMRRSIVNICFQGGAQLILALGTLQTKILAGLGLQVLGLVLYVQIFYLWYDTLKRHRANMSKPRKERDQNVKQAWGLVNTFFVSTNGFLAIVILGLLHSFTSVHEAMLYSALDILTKMIYGAILVRR